MPKETDNWWVEDKDENMENGEEDDKSEEQNNGEENGDKTEDKVIVNGGQFNSFTILMFLFH